MDKKEDNKPFAGGAFDDVQKAVRRSRLSPQEQARKAIRDADAGYRELATDAKQVLDWVKVSGKLDLEAVNRLQKKVLALCLHTDYSQLLESLQMVRFDKEYFQYHAVNVALLNAIIGSQMSIGGERLDRLVRLGLVIDVGMLKLPDKILDGSAELDANDRMRIRLHPKMTEQILVAAGEKDKVLLNAVPLHHERYNGSGYPLGLRGDKIPLEARVTAVSDSFDAAVSRKAYKVSKSPFQVLAEFKENSGGALDPDITDLISDSFAGMLVGRHVMLSDHSIGKVVRVFPDNLAYPLVRVVGRDIQTGPQLYPVSLSSYVPLF